MEQIIVRQIRKRGLRKKVAVFKYDLSLFKQLPKKPSALKRRLRHMLTNYDLIVQIEIASKGPLQKESQVVSKVQELVHQAILQVYPDDPIVRKAFNGES